MGRVVQPIEIGDPRGTRFETVEATVDTGATYTVVPSRTLTGLGVGPIGRMRFRLADDSTVERDIGETILRVLGIQRTNVVVFGADDGPVLLGVVALETLALAVDPVGQRLIPVDGLMLGLRPMSP
jgi:predicted aspartyl protease